MLRTRTAGFWVFRPGPCFNGIASIHLTNGANLSNFRGVFVFGFVQVLYRSRRIREIGISRSTTSTRSEWELAHGPEVGLGCQKSGKFELVNFSEYLARSSPCCHATVQSFVISSLLEGCHKLQYNGRRYPVGLCFTSGFWDLNPSCIVHAASEVSNTKCSKIRS